MSKSDSKTSRIPLELDRVREALGTNFRTPTRRLGETHANTSRSSSIVPVQPRERSNTSTRKDARGQSNRKDASAEVAENSSVTSKRMRTILIQLKSEFTQSSDETLLPLSQVSQMLSSAS